MDHFTQSAGFVIVTYFVATPLQNVMDVSCTIRGNPSVFAAVRIARRKLRFHKLKPLALIKVDRVV
jgi:hypothetical protein